MSKRFQNTSFLCQMSECETINYLKTPTKAHSISITHSPDFLPYYYMSNENSVNMKLIIQTFNKTQEQYILINTAPRSIKWLSFHTHNHMISHDLKRAIETWRVPKWTSHYNTWGSVTSNSMNMIPTHHKRMMCHWFLWREMFDLFLEYLQGHPCTDERLRKSIILCVLLHMATGVR